MRSLALAATLTLALPLAAQPTAIPHAEHHATHKTSHHHAKKSSATRHHAHSVHHVAVAAHPHHRTAFVRTDVARPAPSTTLVPVAAPHVAAAPPTPAPFSQNPIQGLQGNARALLIFAPDTTNAALHQQMQLLSRYELELSESNTVFVPIITQRHGSDIYFGENIRSGTYRDQLSARRKFGIKYNEFAIILLDKDGIEQFRSTTPTPIDTLRYAIGNNKPAGGGE